MLNGEIFEEKTALLMGEGELVEVCALPGEVVRFILASAPRCTSRLPGVDRS